ncbi:MAG: hypothetical protein R3F46_05020 [bacterium]
MRYTAAITILASVFLCIACGGGQESSDGLAGYTLEALHATSSASLHFGMERGSAVVSVDAPASEGSFFRLSLPENMVPGSLEWQDASGDPAGADLLTFAHFEDGVLSAAVMPLGNSLPDACSLRFIPEVDPAARLASATEDEIREEPLPFAVMDFDPVGQALLLSWPAWLPGDYDLDGVVSIQDITPLGKNFGTTSNGNGWTQEEPLHWIDGNRDGEINSADLSVIGQHFNDELIGFRVYYAGSLHQGMDENLLNVLAGDPQGPGLPRRHYLHLPGIDAPELLELRSVYHHHGLGSGGDNPDLEVHVSIDGVELADNEFGNKTGTRVIKPIEDIAGARDIISTPESESGSLARFRSVPRGREYLLDISYEPLESPFGNELPDIPGLQGGEPGRVITSVPFSLPQQYSRSVMNVSIHYLPQPDGSYFAELNASIDHGSGVEQYSALLDYSGGILRRDSDNDGSFAGELEFTDSDRDCVSNQLVEEIFFPGVEPVEQTLLHGVFDGPVESIDYFNSMIIMGEGSIQSWSDGAIREDRSVRFSENALFIGFGDIQSLAPGELVHIEMFRVEDGADTGNIPAGVSWAELIHALDQNFSEYWISAELQDGNELVAISVGRGAGPLDGSYPQYMIAIRDELSGDYLEQPYDEIGTGFIYVPLWPGHFYTLSLLGISPNGAPVLLADTQLLVDPEDFWDGFGDPPGGPAGGPGN